MIKKVFSDKLSRQLNYKHHVVVRLFCSAKRNVWKIKSSRPGNFPQSKYFSIAELTAYRRVKIQKPLRGTLLISPKHIV